jgi:hypothetical protein
MVIAKAITAIARTVCFPNWQLRTDVKQDLFREVTTVMYQQFKAANLQQPASGFVERAIQTVRKDQVCG